MNRFRRKKEPKEILEGSVRPSIESETHPLPPVKKTFRRGKKTPEPDVKQEIDLSTALPSSDDFRTSLLMSGLSARFSMLRELQDPKSSSGKISDDNMILLKRYSKSNMLEFRAHDLSDISEVSSARSSLRPPTETRLSSAGLPRRNDISGSYTPPRSMMDRARPGEGNILFGGRQKINVGNRILYDADVCLTAYQKQRKQERESQKQLSKETCSFSSPIELDCANDPTQSGSNPQAYNSGYSALPEDPEESINYKLSQAKGSLEIPKIKSHRLYNIAPENPLHHQQISSAIRIDTLVRHQIQNVNGPSPAASPIGTLSSQGSQSQNVPKHQFLPPFKGSEIFDSSSIFNSSNFGLFSPPLSPPVSENDETPSLATQFSNNKSKITIPSTSPESCKSLDEDDIIQSSPSKRTDTDNSYQDNSGPLNDVNSPLESVRPSSRAGSDSSYGSSLSTSNSPAQATLQSEWSFSSAAQLSDDPKNSPKLHPNSSSSMIYFDLDHFRRTTNIERPSISEHPMNRDQPFVVSQEEASTGFRIEASSSKSSSSTEPDSTSPFEISKMVRRHMRNPSTASSIYGAVPPVLDDESASHYPGVDSLNEYLTNSNPWEADWDLGCENSVENLEPKSLKSQDSSPRVTLGKSHLDYSLNKPDDHSPSAWKKDTEYHHARHESTDTQREQEDLRNELASRRRQVQEKMRSFVESDSRSPSPLPLPELLKDGLSKSSPFGLLRTKTSRSSVKLKDEQLESHRNQVQSSSSKIPLAKLKSSRENDTSKLHAESTPIRYRSRQEGAVSNGEKLEKTSPPSNSPKSRPEPARLRTQTLNFENANPNRYFETRMSPSLHNSSSNKIKSRKLPIYNKISEHTASNSQNVSSNLHVANFLRNY